MKTPRVSTQLDLTGPEIRSALYIYRVRYPRISIEYGVRSTECSVPPSTFHLEGNPRLLPIYLVRTDGLLRTDYLLYTFSHSHIPSKPVRRGLRVANKQHAEAESSQLARRLQHAAMNLTTINGAEGFNCDMKVCCVSLSSTQLGQGRQGACFFITPTRSLRQALGCILRHHHITHIVVLTSSEIMTDMKQTNTVFSGRPLTVLSTTDFTMKLLGWAGLGWAGLVWCGVVADKATNHASRHVAS